MNKYLPILIFFILADVVADNSILRVFGAHSSSSAFMLSMGMLILQMVAAPIQAGFSDFYCRKKSLIVALTVSLISLLFLFYAMSPGSLSIIILAFVALMKGTFGNTVPLAWGALADTQEKNLRFSLALSTGAYAVGYMVLAISSMYGAKKISGYSWLSLEGMPIIIFVVCILCCAFFFRDVRDKKMRFEIHNKKIAFLRLAHSEFKALLQDVYQRSTRLGLLAYFLWATSQYSVLILLTDFQTQYIDTVIVMMLGYLIGVAILGFCKKIKDEKIIRSAFVITISSLSLYFVFINFTKNIHLLISVCYFFYTIGNAFLSPSILSLFSKDRELHKQGQGFGLIVSADSGGFLFASIVAILFGFFKISFNYIVLFSFIAFVISWIPYSIYEKIRKDADRIENGRSG